MVAIKPSEVERFMARPDPGRPIVLVYGKDAGLVHERAETLIHTFVRDPRDPFQLARLDGDELAGEPARLFEEANTIPLLGGRRAIWVKAGTRNFAPAVETLAAAPSPDCRVVIEAGDLRRNAPLLAVCERARTAAALRCYPDEEKALVGLIEREMRASKLTISPEACAALVPLLGGDRLASRHELRKIALYAQGKERVELEDVRAVVADASSLEVDDLIEAALSGRPDELETQFNKTRVAGTSPGTVMSAALRQLGQLHRARLAVEDGTPLNDAVAAVLPANAPYTRRNALVRVLAMWTAARLLRAMLQLADSALDARRRSEMAAAITHRALLAIAVNVKK